LKALDKYKSLNYFEWYLLNTIIRNDDNLEEEQEFDSLIKQYRSHNLQLKDTDIKENQLSHSYVLGNFEYAGLIIVEGSKLTLKITLNEAYRDVINEIIK